MDLAENEERKDDVGELRTVVLSAIKTYAKAMVSEGEAREVAWKKAEWEYGASPFIPADADLYYKWKGCSDATVIPCEEDKTRGIGEKFTKVWLFLHLF